MAVAKQKVYLDGRNVSMKQDVMTKYSPGHVRGEGVFETFRVEKGIILFLDEHLKRCIKGSALFKIKSAGLLKGISGVMYRNLYDNEIHNGRIRLSVWKNNKKVHLSIIASKANIPKKEDVLKGVNVTVSTIRRNKDKFSHIKSLDYAKFNKAYRLAKEQGFDEALLENDKGDLVEGSRSNIFCIKGKKLFTPAVYCGCLEGITRNQVIRIAQSMGYKVIKGKITLEDLKSSDEAFLTNSFIGVMPIQKVDKFKFVRTNMDSKAFKLYRAWKSKLPV